MPGAVIPLAELVTVIIPACNEESVIGRTLAGLLKGAGEGDLDVVVVCNGCTDDTAGVARSFGPPVRVVEIAAAGKVGAIAVGDGVASSFPRLYLDADVEVNACTVRRLAAVVREGGADAAAPAVRVESSHASWAVRRYVEAWASLPAVRHSLAGRGAYILSEAGHRRLQSMPGVINDDGYVDAVLGGRAVILHDRQVTVWSPSTFGAVLGRRLRVELGNRQLQALGIASSSRGSTMRGLVCAVAERPRLLPSAGVFAFVAVVSRVRASRALRCGHALSWGRDETSREILNTDRSTRPPRGG